MIIGSGLIASGFQSNVSYHFLEKKLVIFASGVSNSAETDQQAYNREKELLHKVIQQKSPDQKLIYFSTISLYDPSIQDSKYLAHKRKIESSIQRSCSNFLIIRTSNIVGRGGNPHTLINFFMDAIIHEKSIKIWRGATRNILDIDDLVKVVLSLGEGKRTGLFDIYYPISYTPLGLVETIGIHMEISPNYTLIEEGADFIPPASDELISYFHSCKIEVTNDYFKKVLEKYWPQS